MKFSLAVLSVFATFSAAQAGGKKDDDGYDYGKKEGGKGGKKDYDDDYYGKGMESKGKGMPSKGKGMPSKGKGGGKKGDEGSCGGYGPLYPTKDSVTGLYLLELPEGFTYSSYGWTGQIMEDGNPTPTDHDGMAVSGVRGDIVSLVRNHECSIDEGPLMDIADSATYAPSEHGGNTNIYFNVATGEWVESYGSLAGTIRNCAGGASPWESWISCEETFQVAVDGLEHGFVFDVPAFGLSNGKPVRSAGRFNHEAVAFDPSTGIMYETEDTGASGIYKYVMPGAGDHWEPPSGPEQFFLEDGGDLYAIAVVGECGKDMTKTFEDGTQFHTYWVPVLNPEAPNTEDRDTVKNSAECSATFARGEGAWWSDKEDLFYFVSTSGGDIGRGQVYTYDPKTDILTMMYEVRDNEIVDRPDNIAIAANGNTILCEDGSSIPKRMVGLTLDGETFNFAKNIIRLNEDDLKTIDHYYPGTEANFWDSVVVEGHPGLPVNFYSREWAGATFYGDYLFANVQSPGVTFAITGPWENGAFGDHCH